MPRGVYERKKSRDEEAKGKSSQRVPFYQLVAERMEETTEATKTALSQVYGTNDPLLIDAYEQAIDFVNNLGIEGKIKRLEALLGGKSSSQESGANNGRKGGRKQELTRELYEAAKRNGLTIEQLTEKYDFSRQKLGSMRRYYGMLRGE